MIKLQVIGNLGKDAMVNNANGKTVINFSVAHTEKFKDNAGNQKDKTIWVECAYWTDRTAISPYLKKGTQVYVEGFPDIRSYQTQDGRQGASLTLRVTTVQLIGTRQAGDENNYTPQQPNNNYNRQAVQQQESNDVVEPADDLPF